MEEIDPFDGGAVYRGFSRKNSNPFPFLFLPSLIDFDLLNFFTRRDTVLREPHLCQLDPGLWQSLHLARSLDGYQPLPHLSLDSEQHGGLDPTGSLDS